MSSIGKTTREISVSASSIEISGISCTVHGLKELSDHASTVTCLWLLHPRHKTASSMTELAAMAISSWNDQEKSKDKGLIAIAFDQRNHGSRLINSLNNESWKKGNATHAQDMFAIYKGTADDCSRLIDDLPKHLPSQVPMLDQQHIVLGVSLGGHAAWHSILHDKRITAAVIVIGCPDFARLMAQRASKSQLIDWDESNRAGESFFGSSSFPLELIAHLDAADPAAFLLPAQARADNLPPLASADHYTLTAMEPSEKRKIIARLNQRLDGKAILNLSGGRDKLVPYSCGKPFLDFLKSSIDKDHGWWNKKAFHLEDVIYPDAKHENTLEMMSKSIDFIEDVLSGSIETTIAEESKI